MLSFADYIVVGTFVVIPALVGCIYALCKRPNHEEFVLGGRMLGLFPIAISTVVGFFAINQNFVNVYSGDLYYRNGTQIFTVALATVIAIPLSMALFLPVLHKLKLTSVFEYLEYRFESPLLRVIGSCLFIISTSAISVFILRIPCTLIESIFYIPRFLSIMAIGVCAILYSAMGGLASVVLGHCLQFLVIVATIIIVTIKSFEVVDGFAEILNRTILMNSEFDWAADPFSRTNDLNTVFGFGFSLMCLYGIHQSQYQRYSAVKTHGRAQISMGLSILFSTLTLAGLALVSLVIITAYCSMEGDGIPVNGWHSRSSVQTLLTFITKMLSKDYGLNGLLIAGISSFMLSIISSTIHSLAVLTFEDVIVKIPKSKPWADSTSTNTIRALVLMYGIIVILISEIPIEMGSYSPLAMELYFLVIVILGTMFLAGMLIPFINKYGIGFGSLIGLCSMVVYSAYPYWGKTTSFDHEFLQEKQNMDTPICEANLSSKIDYLVAIDSDGWSQVMMHIAEPLRPILGFIITLTLAIIVSVLTGGCCRQQVLNLNFLHPILHCCFNRERNSLDDDEYPNNPLLKNHNIANSFLNVDRLARGTSTFSLFHHRYESVRDDELPMPPQYRR